MRVRGLKLSASSQRSTISKSHPMRVRGLKQLSKDYAPTC